MRRFLWMLMLGAAATAAAETADEEIARLKREREALDRRIEALEAGKAAPAADPNLPRPAEVTLKPGERPNRVIVTDTRKEHDVADSGRSVTVLDAETLQVAGRPLAQDALRNVQSVQVVRTGTTGGATSVFIRGGESDHMAVMVDGIRMNKDGGSFDFENLAIDEVDRIEVLRGAGSSLYGSDAIAGVVNLVTKRGEGPPALKTSLEYGSFERWRERIALSGGDDRFGYRIGLSNFTQRGTRFHNSDFDARNFAGRFDLKLSPDADGILVVRNVDSETQAYTTNAGARFESTDPNDRKTRSDGLVSFTLLTRPSTSWDSRLTFSRYSSSTDFDTISEPHEIGEGFGESYFTTAFVRQGGTWQNDWRLPGGHLLSAGFDYEQEEYDQLYHSVGNTANASDQVDTGRTNRGFFVQDLWEVHDRLHFSASGRRDDNSDFSSEDTGQVAGSWQVAEGGPRLHSHRGRGIKVPTFYEIHGDPFTPGLKTRSDGVRVERSNTFDAGVEQAFGWLRVDATWFEHRYKDLVEYESFTIGYGQSGRAYARGWEFSADADPTEKWALHADLTVMDTKVVSTRTTGSAFVENDELLRRARLQGNASALYRATPDLYGRLGMRYMGSRVDRNFFASSNGFRQRLGSYTLFDLATSWTLPDRRWRVFANVENLLDRPYEEVLGFPAPGMNWMGGVEYQHAF